MPNVFKQIVLLWLVLLTASTSGQKSYRASNHVGYRVDVEGNNYVVRYTFKDHKDNSCSITWKLDKEKTDTDIRLFGIPRTMFDPYPVIPEVLSTRKRILEEGLFMKQGSTLLVDKNAMINAYSSYTKIVADWMIGYLKDYYSDTRQNRIELAMRFVQDIPYGIPDDLDPNWFYGGVIATPNIFTCGYGDCDTKAILFVGLLCHLIDPTGIRFAGEPGHMYTIIKADESVLDQRGTKAYFVLNDGRYYVAETAGPGRLNFGEKGAYLYRGAMIEKVQFNPLE